MSTPPPTVSAGELTQFAQNIRDYTKVDLVDVGGGNKVAVVPRGMSIQSIKALYDEYLEAPERKSGIATIMTLDSFVGFVNRAKLPETVLFGKPNRREPTLTAVLNYNHPNEGLAGWRDHRAVYSFPLAETWVAWGAKHGEKMSQIDFAEWIEARLADIVEPPSADKDEDKVLVDLANKLGARFAGPSALLALSRGLKINVESTVGQAIDTTSGETSVVFEEKHSVGGNTTGGPVRVPNFFAIAIPVFDRGPAYRLAVRLRYRKDGQRLSWYYDIYQADRAFMDAFDNACVDASVRTELPLYYGAPEGSHGG